MAGESTYRKVRVAQSQPEACQRITEHLLGLNSAGVCHAGRAYHTCHVCRATRMCVPCVPCHTHPDSRYDSLPTIAVSACHSGAPSISLRTHAVNPRLGAPAKRHRFDAHARCSRVIYVWPLYWLGYVTFRTHPQVRCARTHRTASSRPPSGLEGSHALACRIWA